MEEEIDLRAYILVLLRNWPWIVGLAVVFAAVVFIVSSALPATYEASAVVLVTEPRYQLQFDSRFSTQETQPAPRAFPVLAKSDSVLQSVVNTYTPPAAAGIEVWNLTTLSHMLSASSEGDPTLLLLTVTSRSPQAAAEIANVWADALVARGNEIYAGGEADVVFLEQQLAQAGGTLDQAESALVAFKARDQSELLLADLASLSLARADYLASQRTTNALIHDLHALRKQIANGPANQGASLADGLTALLVQLRAFSGRLVETTETDVQVQVPVPITLQISDENAFLARGRDEQLAVLERLASSLEERSSEIESALASLEPQMLSLQQQIQALEVENDRLTRERQLKRDTYTTLARKLDEARIATQEETGSLQVGSQAAVPRQPAGPRRMFNTLVAGAMGGMLGVVLAFAIEFWRQDRAGHTSSTLASEG